MKHFFRYFYITAALLAVHLTNAQTADPALYAKFDNNVGKKNLGLYNGTVHLNTLRSADNSNRYYPADQYNNGNIVYDGQPYANIPLKYDLLKDIIIVKTADEKGNLGINLITEKTEMFTINGKKFVNINFMGKALKFQGFYEQDVLTNQLVFYTKYRKANIEVLRNDGVFYKYETSNDFVFEYQNRYHPINSKADAMRAFPQLEKEVQDFFNRNTALERSDKKLFFMTLLKQLHNSLVNQ